MVKTVLRRDFSNSTDQLVEEVVQSGAPIVIEEDGRRVAVLISPDAFDENARSRFWTTVDDVRAQNADQDPDEILAFVSEVVNEVRRDKQLS